jgi:hypothetical protein
VQERAAAASAAAAAASAAVAAAAVQIDLGALEQQHQQRQQRQVASRAFLEDQRRATLGKGPPLPQSLMQIFVSATELTQLSPDWLKSQLEESHAQEIVAKYEADDRVCRARAFALMAAMLECKELNLKDLNKVV